MLANFGFKALHVWALYLVLAAALAVGPVISAPVATDGSTRYEWVGWQFIGGVSSGPVLEIGDEVKIRFIGEGGRSGKILSFPIDSERQRNNWITALPSRVERADIGIRMGSVSSQGAFVDLPKNTSLYYYAISPGTFSSVITEIHHVGGDFTVLPTLASPDQQDTMLFEVPARAPRNSEFGVRAGAFGAGITGTLNVQVFDVPSRQLIHHRMETIDGSYAPAYRVKPPAGIVGPLQVIANIYEHGESGRSYQKFHTVAYTAADDAAGSSPSRKTQ